MSARVKMKRRHLKTIPGVMFLIGVTVCIARPEPSAGTFRSHCHERHFVLSVRSSFLGDIIGFAFEDHNGFHFPSGRAVTECGYTMLLNHHGDLVFRASFLACHVQSQNDADYDLRLWFENRWPNGSAQAYPFHLHCALLWPWAPREMVCEENYMEVSVLRPILPASYKAPTEGGDVQGLGLLVQRAGPQPEEAGPLSEAEAASLGYHVSRTGSRLTLRAGYSSPLSYTVKEKGVHLEVVSATILYPLHGILLAIDTTVACNRNASKMDGSDLLWSALHVAPPLVRGMFVDGGMRFGVESVPLREQDIAERGYQLRLNDGLLELRVPFGAQGGRVKSGVEGGKYGRFMSVDLFFMRQWVDQVWPLTQLRTFSLLRTPLVPQTPVITNNTVPSEGRFSVALGSFHPDVSLRKVMAGVGGDLLRWNQSTNGSGEDQGAVTRLPHPNGSHSYRLDVPFSHANVIQEYIGGGYKKYSLPLTFTFEISPRGEVFYHRTTVESTVQEFTEQDLGSPRLEGVCLERSLRILLFYGSLDMLQWELFLGPHRLDWELVEMGGYSLKMEEDYFSVEIPFSDPGMIFEELTLRGVVARVEVSVVDVDSLEEQGSLVQRCTFPVGELLVCLPEGRIVAVVDTTHTIPPGRPNRTTLADPSCVPLETDSARALFSFNVDTCGTTVTTEGNVLVYENQVRYLQDFLPSDDPVIHRDSAFRLTIQCRYPADSNQTMSLRYPLNSTLQLPPAQGHRTRREANSKGSLSTLWITWILASILLLTLFLYLKIAAAQCLDLSQ